MFALNDDYGEDEITKQICKECKGEGFVTVERGTVYRGEECKWCRGTGRMPMSGTFPKTSP